MDRREKMLGIAEKLPKSHRKTDKSSGNTSTAAAGRPAVIALNTRRTNKRR
jgi:hypothetical protein